MLMPPACRALRPTEQTAQFFARIADRCFADDTNTYILLAPLFADADATISLAIAIIEAAEAIT